MASEDRIALFLAVAFLGGLALLLINSLHPQPPPAEAPAPPVAATNDMMVYCKGPGVHIEFYAQRVTPMDGGRFFLRDKDGNTMLLQPPNTITCVVTRRPDAPPPQASPQRAPVPRSGPIDPETEAKTQT